MPRSNGGGILGRFPAHVLFSFQWAYKLLIQLEQEGHAVTIAQEFLFGIGRVKPWPNVLRIRPPIDFEEAEALGCWLKAAESERGAPVSVEYPGAN